MPKVSVIIPVYKTEDYLRKCLDSVCNQTLKDIEIICINDCSPDGCLEILKEYASKDERIKIIDFKENKGAACARNAGIDAAQGEYLGFVDSDDFIDLDFYEKLYNKALETGADAVKGKLYLYNLKTQKMYLQGWIDINDKVKTHKANFYFTFTTAIYKKDFLQKYNIKFLENLIHFEDPYFTIHACLHYDKIEIIDSAKYYYVENSNSTSRNISNKHLESLLDGIQKTVDLLNNNCTEKHHYVIVFNFLFNQLLSWCNRPNISNKNIVQASRGLLKLILNCKYQEEFIEYHFIEKSLDSQKNILNILRNKVRKDIINA